MKRQHASSGITRRAFLRSAAVTMGALASMPILAACSPAAPAQPTSAAPANTAIAPAATPAPAAAPTSASAPQATAAPAAKAITTLTFTTFWVDQKGWLEPLIAATEKATSTKFEMDYVEVSSLTAKLKAALGGGKGPDLFAIQNPSVEDFAKAGTLLDLTPHLKANGGAWEKTFDPGSFDEFTVDGKIYSVPCNVTVSGLYYNKALLSKYGLQPPKTLADMYGWVDKLKADGIAPYGWGSGDSWYPTQLFISTANQTLGPDAYLALNSQGKGSWDSPAIVEAFRTMAEMKAKGLFPQGSEALGWQDVKKVFHSEKVATWQFHQGQIDIFRNEKVLKTASQNGLEVGVTLIPALKPEGKGIVQGNNGGAIFINSDSKKAEQALEALRFINGPEGRKLTAAAYKIPTGPFSMEGVKLEEPYATLLKFFIDQSPSKAWLGIRKTKVNVAATSQVQAVMVNKATPEEAAKALAEADKA